MKTNSLQSLGSLIVFLLLVAVLIPSRLVNSEELSTEQTFQKIPESSFTNQNPVTRANNYLGQPPLTPLFGSNYVDAYYNRKGSSRGITLIGPTQNLGRTPGSNYANNSINTPTTRRYNTHSYTAFAPRSTQSRSNTTCKDAKGTVLKVGDYIQINKYIGTNSKVKNYVHRVFACNPIANSVQIRQNGKMSWARTSSITKASNLTNLSELNKFQ